MKTRFTVEALALVGMAAGLAVTSGCRTTYSDNSDLSLEPMPASLAPEEGGNVTLPVSEAEKPKPYWQQHPEAVSALDKTPAVTASAGNAGKSYSGYVVKSGDSLSKIAAAHGFRTADIVAVNPGINPNKIRVGQHIVLPGASSAKPVSAKATAPKAVAAGGTYVVKKGDILGRIAIKHGVKVADLKKANGLTSDKIAIGQKLVIPGAKTVAQPKNNGAKLDPVQPKVTTSEVQSPKAPTLAVQPQVKPSSQTAVAPVGKEVAPPVILPPSPTTVVPPAVEVAPPAAKGTPYTVQEGQDLYDIAVQWSVRVSDIKALNNLTSDEVTPGQTLMIPVQRAE